MKFTVNYAVWSQSGWQPHDINDDHADTIVGARTLAFETISYGAQLGDVIATITDNETDKVVAKLS